jgi:hypothetical protein
VIATPTGLKPTVIAVPGVLVAVSMGHRVRVGVGDVGGLAVGVIAIPSGPLPTGIAVPAVLVVVSIGVTELAMPSVT